MSRIQLQKPIVHLPSFKESDLTIPELRRLIHTTYPDIKLYLWDRSYWYISHENWGKVFADVLLNMPSYTADRFDCENYSLLTSARISSKYQLNSCGIAIGASPFGEHGYCIFISQVDGEPELFLLEPQNGMIFSVDDNSGYFPRLIIFA